MVDIKASKTVGTLMDACKGSGGKLKQPGLTLQHHASVRETTGHWRDKILVVTGTAKTVPRM